MLYALTNYFHERRRGFKRAAGYIGGAYLLGHYILERLDDVRSQMMQDRQAKENLRKRFDQNQQDICYTIMALLPTLGRHILEGMDVEGVTLELQSFAKSSKTQSNLKVPAAPSESSMASSIVLVGSHHDGSLEHDSGSVISSVTENGIDHSLHSSSMSWVDELSMQSSQLSIKSSIPQSEADLDVQGPRQNGDASPSASGTSTASSSMIQDGSNNSPAESIATDTMRISVTKNKAELWKEVKILTFTRTLTVIYSVTLLSILTHIQLNLLGRSKYIQSIKQMEREERVREWQQYLSSPYPAFWDGYIQPLGDPDIDLEDFDELSEETERKYLTLSWWILHVGWKDIGERVRRGVEEVFEGVSLKTMFTINDLFRLVGDIRRRVEHEVTFEGQERRINFMSALIPPTPETLQHVLIKGGIPADVASSTDYKFQDLLSETHTQILSGSCQRVMEVCLDQATEILFSGLQKHVFSSASTPNGSDAGDQEARERLAAMLPGLARWCHLAVHGLPNELVDGLAAVRDLQAFSAILYSSYEDQFR